MRNFSCTMLKHKVSLWQQRHHFLLLGKWLQTVTISAEPLHQLIMTQFRVFVQIMISQGKIRFSVSQKELRL